MLEKIMLFLILFLIFLIYLAVLVAGRQIIHEQYVMCLYSGAKGC